MERITVTLISGRTAKQGIGLEEGKLSKNYAESVNRIQINPDDADKIKLKKEDRVNVVTDFGEVTVNWEPEKGLPLGTIFFPYGPWANQVYASATSGTGMPIMKGIKAKMGSSKDNVLTIEELVEKLRREA
jgi:formylmethanofuran dehydrogenase subunit D